MDREAWRAAIHGVPKSWTDWSDLIWSERKASSGVRYIVAQGLRKAWAHLLLQGPWTSCLSFNSFNPPICLPKLYLFQSSHIITNLICYEITQPEKLTTPYSRPLSPFVYWMCNFQGLSLSEVAHILSFWVRESVSMECVSLSVSLLLFLTYHFASSWVPSAIRHKKPELHWNPETRFAF